MAGRSEMQIEASRLAKEKPTDVGINLSFQEYIDKEITSKISEVEKVFRRGIATRLAIAWVSALGAVAAAILSFFVS